MKTEAKMKLPYDQKAINIIDKAADALAYLGDEFTEKMYEGVAEQWRNNEPIDADKLKYIFGAMKYKYNARLEMSCKHCDGACDSLSRQFMEESAYLCGVLVVNGLNENIN